MKVQARSKRREGCESGIATLSPSSSLKPSWSVQYAYLGMVKMQVSCVKVFARPVAEPDSPFAGRNFLSEPLSHREPRSPRSRLFL